jgi:WhiB family redox-sensing transcriptional regulator
LGKQQRKLRRSPPVGTEEGAVVADVVYLMPRWTQQDWMAEAACKGQTALFFAPHGEQAEARGVREAQARAICLECPALNPCREYARRNREQGFWGAENDEDRMEARRRSRTGRPLAAPFAAEG